MFLSVIAITLIGYGYVSGELGGIIIGLIVGILAIRQTVFSSDKIGTLVNFIILIVGVALGTLNFYGFKIPDFADDDIVTNKQETPTRASQRSPVVNNQSSNNRPIVATPPALSPASPPPSPDRTTIAPVTKPATPIAPRRPVSLAKSVVYNPDFAEQAPCVEPSQFEHVVMSTKDTSFLELKICRTSKPIEVRYAMNKNQKMDIVIQDGHPLQWPKRAPLLGDFLNVKKAKNTKNAMEITPIPARMQKAGVDFVMINIAVEDK